MEKSVVIQSLLFKLTGSVGMKKDEKIWYNLERIEN